MTYNPIRTPVGEAILLPRPEEDGVHVEWIGNVSEDSRALGESWLDDEGFIEAARGKI